MVFDKIRFRKLNVMKKILAFFILVFAASAMFAQSENQTEYQRFDPALFADGVTSISVYVRDQCGRCHDMILAFDDAGIVYKKIDMTSQEAQQELDRKIYNALPEKGMGYSVRFPVVEVNEVLYFKLENHHDFIIQFIEFMKNE